VVGGWQERTAFRPSADDEIDTRRDFDGVWRRRHFGKRPTGELRRD
jgi:hypothetical protein